MTASTKDKPDHSPKVTMQDVREAIAQAISEIPPVTPVSMNEVQAVVADAVRAAFSATSMITMEEVQAAIAEALAGLPAPLRIEQVDIAVAQAVANIPLAPPPPPSVTMDEVRAAISEAMLQQVPPAPSTDSVILPAPEHPEWEAMKGWFRRELHLVREGHSEESRVEMHP